MRQQLRDPAWRLRRQALEDVTHVGVRVEPIELGRVAAVEHRSTRRGTTTGGLSIVTKLQRINPPALILQLHIELRGMKSKEWWRVLVPNTITLAKLHSVIQAALGWNRTHMHEFIASDGERYGSADPFDAMEGVTSREKIRVDDRAARCDADLRLRLRRLLGTSDRGRGDPGAGSTEPGPVVHWGEPTRRRLTTAVVSRLRRVRAGYGRPASPGARQSGRMDWCRLLGPHRVRQRRG